MFYRRKPGQGVRPLGVLSLIIGGLLIHCNVLCQQEGLEPSTRRSNASLASLESGDRYEVRFTFFNSNNKSDDRLRKVVLIGR